MKGHSSWDYHPYKPPLFKSEDIYICRIVPYTDRIHFEWLEDVGECGIFYRKRGEGEFIEYIKTSEKQCDIVNLRSDTDYEFYVAAGDKKSRVRLARTGESVGIVVNYLHPEDEAYSFSGKYLCSPSLLRHPDGFLLASMDLYAGGYPQNLTLIFRSDDDGETWHYVSELMPCFWGKMFIHKGELYMLSSSTEYGDLLIGKSTDGGKTFTTPVCLMRGSNGKAGKNGWHTNPQNMLVLDGRLYRAIEWGNWVDPEFKKAATVISCAVDDDLLVPENWTFSEPKTYTPYVKELGPPLPSLIPALEGTLTVAPNGKLLNVMRFHANDWALAYEVNTEDPDAPVEFYDLFNFPANRSKFMIKFHEKSGRYYSVATRVYDRQKEGARNLLSLMTSYDLKNWYVVTDLLDYRHCDHLKVGFQYVDFEFEGDDIIFLCRTAINNAQGFHDANYSTFHRIKNFADLEFDKI